MAHYWAMAHRLKTPGLQQLMALLITEHTQTHHKKTFKVLQLNANGICNKTDEIQQLIKNTQADVITIQETKLNQSHKTPNIPQLTPRDCTHKQGGGLLPYIKNSINFSQLNTSNTFSIELQIIKIHLSAAQKLHIANMYIAPSYHKQKKTQLYSARLQP